MKVTGLEGNPIKWKNVAVALVLMFTTITAGCGKDKESATLAEIDGKEITRGEFDAYLKFKRIPPENGKRLDSVLDQYLERAALATAVEKTGTLDESMIDAELDEFRKEMLISRYFEKFLNESVTDAAVQNYYNTHTNEFEDQRVQVAHILIRTNSKMSEPERQAKLTTAQEAYSKIQAGEDFAKIAESYSEDKMSAKKGGDLGWIREGSIDAAFSKRIFEMKPGEISEPFETPFGFHVVKLIEGPKTVRKPFEAVSGDIRYQLRNQAKEAEVKRMTSNVQIKKVSKQ